MKISSSKDWNATTNIFILVKNSEAHVNETNQNVMYMWLPSGPTDLYHFAVMYVEAWDQVD